MIVDLALFLISIFLYFYDFITYPFYLILQRPWEKRKEVKKNTNYSWKRTEDYISVTKNVLKETEQHTNLIKKNNVDTIFKVWQNSVQTYGDKKCLGTR